MLRLLTLTIALTIPAALGFQIEASPNQITIGVTRYLTVNCTTTADSISGMASLLSLIIYRSHGADDTNFIELDSINVFQSSGHVIENIRDNQTSTGVIDTNNQSYLSLVWEYPDASKAGLYKCEANGMNFAGHPVAINSTVLVAHYSPNIDILVGEIRNMNSKIEQLSRVDATQNRTINGINSSVHDLKNNQEMWKGRMESIKNLLFTDSIIYNNHFYFLSNPRALMSNKDSEAFCEFFGGYLVEIDSIDEFNALRAVVLRHPEFEFVMTGATEEGHVGHWVNIHSGTVVSNIQWATGQPSAHPKFSCLWFGKDSNWYIIEGNCYIESLTRLYGFMCEIPNQNKIK